MELIPWRSRQQASPLSNLQTEMNRMFEQFLHQPFGQPFGYPAERGNGHGVTIVPALDVEEDDKYVTVTAELPGIDREDVHIAVQDDMLEIRGHKTQERKQDGDNFRMVERSYGSFARRIALPAEVDSNKAEAKLERGVLTLRLPKSGPKPGMKEIEVQ